MKGHLVEVRPGTWRCWIDLPRGEDNKRRQKVVTFQAAGKREAESKKAKLVADACAGKISAPSRTTLHDYAIGWLRHRRADGAAPKTLETWADFLRAYIGPHLGAKALEKIQPREVREFYTFLLERGRKTGDGLSPQTVTHVARLLSSILKTAVREGLCAGNPCEQVSLPRIERKERQIGDESILPKLLAAAGETWIRLPLLIAASTGLRRGEILGLCWDCVDLKAGTLSVRQSSQTLRGIGTEFRTPKTSKSRRTLTIPEFLVDELRKHKGWQAAHRLEMGGAWNDYGLVVTQEDGRPRTGDNLTHAFRKLVERADLPAMSFHGLRHLAASIQIAEGVPLKVVSERLGHASVAITGDLYAHLLQRSDEDAARATDAAFRRALGA